MRTRTRGVEVTDAVLDQVPRPLRLIVEAQDDFARRLEASQGDPMVALAQALEDVRKASRRIAALAEPFDAFDVLECVRLSEAPHNPETYRETEHEGSAAAIELAAIVLATRGHRAGSLPELDGHRPRPDGVIAEILDECHAALAAGSKAVVLKAICDAGTEGTLQLGALVREIFERNLSFDHMVEATLGRLFDEPAIEAACRSAMGCSVSEIRAVFDSLMALHEREWQRRIDVVRDFTLLVRAEMGKAALKSDYSISPETKAQGTALWSEAWGDPADASVFPVDVVAAEARVDISVVTTIVKLFGVDMAERDPADAALEFFEGRSGFRVTPILSDPTGGAVVVHGGLLMPSIRERVEMQLKASPDWERYAKHRGDFLEQAALDLLEPHLPTCVVHRGLEYFVPDPNAVIPQMVPADFTKLVESDGLLVVDDVALVIEAKAGSLTELSRTGDARRLASDLKKIVTAAADQAERLRQRIRADHGLRLRSGSWLDLGHVREVHSIAASLDDLSGITTVTSELVRAGILSGPELPWTVSLHDLRIIAELVERPAELLLYIQRRTEPDVTRRFHAVDELDFFLEFYATGLYVEPDPDRIQAERPQFGDPGVAARRRHRNQGLTILTSRTDQLDAWYFHELGLREAPSAKPRFNANSDLCVLVDALAARRQPGWLTIGTAMLNADGPFQAKFARHAHDLATLGRNDGKPHSLCAAGGGRADDSFVLVWATAAPGGPRVDDEKRLELYVTAKKHQVQARWGAGLLFDAADPSAPSFTTYDGRVPGPDAELDELVEACKLRPVGRTFDTVPRPGQRGRVTKPKR
ncbi:MAG: hypothetical protein ACYDGN_15430 [Acidimicrobiales bacterium]